jgi:ABC-type antimicrobial peptide transport system permease subunit
MSVIINESLANLIGKDPVGKTLFRDTSESGDKGIRYTIMGVAKDFIYGDMKIKSDPLVFQCAPADYFGYMYIKLNPNADKSKAKTAIETIMKKYNPAYPFNYVFVDDEYDQQFKAEMVIGKLSRVFALLAIIISCLGLFGLAAYTAERRTKEIGIRKVLGATVQGITGLLSKDFLLLVAISAIVAFPVAWWLMYNWLLNYDYHIAISWWVFLVAGVLALVIALATIIFQSIRAAIANPVKSLRTE